MEKSKQMRIEQWERRMEFERQHEKRKKTLIREFNMQIQSIQNAGNTVDHKKFQKIKENFFRKIASRKPSKEIKRDRPENIELPRRREEERRRRTIFDRKEIQIYNKTEELRTVTSERTEKSLSTAKRNFSSLEDSYYEESISSHGHSILSTALIPQLTEMDYINTIFRINVYFI